MLSFQLSAHSYESPGHRWNGTDTRAQLLLERLAHREGSNRKPVFPLGRKQLVSDQACPSPCSRGASTGAPPQSYHTWSRTYCRGPWVSRRRRHERSSSCRPSRPMSGISAERLTMSHVGHNRSVPNLGHRHIHLPRFEAADRGPKRDRGRVRSGRGHGRLRTFGAKVAPPRCRLLGLSTCPRPFCRRCRARRPSACLACPRR